MMSGPWQDYRPPPMTVPSFSDSSLCALSPGDFKSVSPLDNMLVSDSNLSLLDASAELISQMKLITANRQQKQKFIIKAALGTGV